MANRQRIGVDLLLNAAGFLRGQKEAGQATKALGVDLEKLTIKVRANAEATVSATVRKHARLREEITTYRQIAKAAEKGSREQIAAANLATQAEHRLSRSLGVTAAEAHRFGVSASRAERDVSLASRGALAGSGAFSHLGRSIAFASGWFIGGVGFVGAAKKAISEASDLQAQMGRTTEVFRQSGNEVQRWSKNSAKNLGLSSAAALEAADTIGTLLENVGQAPPVAARMSRSLVKLAVDMAAFKKVAPDVALNALEAALTGRTRSLKQFGLVIDNVAIKAEALRDGILKAGVDPAKVGLAADRVGIAIARRNQAVSLHGTGSVEAAQANVALKTAQIALAKATAGATGQLTAQQKALATYQLILRQTKDQQGAFAKNQGELAIKEQVFRAALANTEAVIGNRLLPTATKYIGTIGEWLSKSSNQAKVARDVGAAVRVMTVGIHFAAEGAKQAVDAFKALSSALGGDKRAVEALGAAFVTWKLAAKFAALGGESTSAAGKVGLLTSRLKTLAGLGVIAVGVELIIHRKAVDKTVSNFLDKHGLGFLSGDQNKINLPKGTTNLEPLIKAAKAAHDPFLVSALENAQAKVDASTPGVGRGSKAADLAAKVSAAAGRTTAPVTRRSGDQPAPSRPSQAGSVTPKITVPTVSAAKTSPPAAKLPPGFQVPLGLLRDAARASTTKGLGDDIRVAREIRAYAQKVIKSGKSSLQAQIDAWNEIAAQNAVIAQGVTNAGKRTTHSVVASAEKLTAGIHFGSVAARRAEEARISQALAHGGHIPTGHPVAGQTITLHSHTYLDGREVERSTTTHQQRNGSYTAVQTRGPHAGRNTRVH